jgi:hypothetical protein
MRAKEAEEKEEKKRLVILNSNHLTSLSYESSADKQSKKNLLVVHLKIERSVKNQNRIVYLCLIII